MTREQFKSEYRAARLFIRQSGNIVDLLDSGIRGFAIYAATGACDPMNRDFRYGRNRFRFVLEARLP